MNEQQFRNVIKFFNDKHLEQNPQKGWDKNTLENLPRFTKERSIWNLCGKHEKQAIIVVGASPCLNKDAKELAKLEKHPRRRDFVIIVVNSALKPCLKAGIKPDYVIALDGNPETIVEDLNCDNEHLTLIASNNVTPEIFKTWKGTDVWWSPYYCLSKDVVKKVKPILGKRMTSGGNTITAAMGISYSVFNARIFIIVGAEHCYDNQYYAHKKSRWEENDDIAHWKVKDVKGRERWTNMPLWQYKIWIEHMVNDLPHVRFVDTSWGILGTDTDRISHLDLKDAIEKTIEAFDITEEAKTNPILNEKLRYDAAYATGHYFPEAGIGFWRKLLKRIQLNGAKKILDVGTGIGQVVAHLRNLGYEAYGTDISDGARPYWSAANISQFCKVCPAHELPFEDNEFHIVSCTEVLEHIPEEIVLDSLKEMYRVGRGDFIFTYALSKAINKMPNDGTEPHITIKPMDWWTQKFKEAGFHIVHMAISSQQNSCTVVATKGKKNAKGKLSLRTMHIQSKEGMHLRGNFSYMESGDKLPESRDGSLH